MRLIVSLSRLALACAMAASAASPGAEPSAPSLSDARRGFTTKIIKTMPAEPPVPLPPREEMQIAHYQSPAGKMVAYVTPDPGQGKRLPAIVWITGGDSNSIGEMWSPKPRSNDQSAAAYRKAGVVTMFPALRGGNDNPGRREGFYGEVDDVLAAAAYLKSLPYVDPEQVYLGGHSTGGTLAMLVAESAPAFRAVFAFGPVSDIRDYGGSYIFYDAANARESQLRAPGRWLASVKTPLYVIEGEHSGNMEVIKPMQAGNSNRMVRFITVAGKQHFDILAPANETLAARIMAGAGKATPFEISAADIKAFGRP